MLKNLGLLKKQSSKAEICFEVYLNFTRNFMSYIFVYLPILLLKSYITF